VPDLLANGRGLARWAEDRKCAGVIFDSVAPLVAAAGLNENDAANIRAFVYSAGKPISDYGALAYFIDHKGHEADRARGSSAKGDACDFSAVIEQTAAFARGISGQIAIKVDKDRSGRLPKDATMLVDVPAQTDGRIVLEPHGVWDDGTPPVPQIGPTQQAIIDLIRDLGRSVSAKELAVKLDKDYDAIRTAANRAVKSGYLRKDQEKYALPI
jgi:hypothetical protein